MNEQWMSLAAAADRLGESYDGFLKRIERAARRAPDGGIEAEISGVRARKLGRSWKVRLSERWTSS